MTMDVNGRVFDVIRLLGKGKAAIPIWFMMGKNNLC